MYKSRSTLKLPMHQLLVLIATSLTFGCILASSQRTDTLRPPVNRLLVVTVVADPNHEGFQRFNRSIQTYGLELSVLTPSADQATRPERRLELYRKALAVHKNEQDLLVMLVESQNLVFNGDRKAILQRFERFSPETRILFSAESTCWPEAKLESNYPTPIAGGDRFLNSAAFLGYAPALWDLLNLSNEVDGPQSDPIDQLYYTNAYLKREIRDKLAVELDHRAELFQSLRSLESDVELELNEDGAKLKNVAYLTEPVVVQANSNTSRVVLNSLGNYLAKSWTVGEGCRYCKESMIPFGPTSDSMLPTVLIGLFIEEATPFLDSFFADVAALNYPRKRVHIFLHSVVEYHDKHVSDFVGRYRETYASHQVFKTYGEHSVAMNESQARNLALERCNQIYCDYYLALDSVARLENQDTLRLLIETNRNIVAPLLSRPNKLWSDFWGSLTDEGYYARSRDYVELVKRNRLGVWNVAHLMNAYLVRGKFIRENFKSDSSSKLTYHIPNSDLKPVLAFTHRLRESDVFLYLNNIHDFGHLVDPSSYNISLKYPELYELENNIHDWDQRYIHENYSRVLDNDTSLEKPCPDVAWFPLVSDLFCQQMIELMEDYGQWSGGTNYDPRIEGGYESVPTRDIHLKQVGLHEMWLTFMREYVMPVQLKEFIGYEHGAPQAELAFVVRYHPAEQASLQPHHDASTYTLNIALNKPHLDYEGGGCRFIRYNCSVTESRRGWGLIHPGRLTHYHEGLPVLNGTRYILVTFVDP